MHKDILHKIVHAANLAPSGGNSQPWKFKIHDEMIEIFIFPEKDHPVLNFQNRGTYVGLGAMLENVEITSESLGYQTEFQINQNHARIIFREVETLGNNELAEVIPQRHSNRKPYRSSPLSENEKEYIFSEKNKFPECDLILLEEDEINHVAKHITSEILVFLQNELMHRLLFREVLWKEHHQHSRSGLYIKTMEITPPKSIAFKLISNWRIAKFFHKIKITSKIHQENSKIAQASGLIGFIATENLDKNFIEAGRFLENIWLRATKLDLGFQMVSSILFLWQQVNFGKAELFSETEKNIINEAYNQLLQKLKIENKIIALAFRVGKAAKPMAVSHKRPPEII